MLTNFCRYLINVLSPELVLQKVGSFRINIAKGRKFRAEIKLTLHLVRCIPLRPVSGGTPSAQCTTGAACCACHRSLQTRLRC